MTEERRTPRGTGQPDPGKAKIHADESKAKEHAHSHEHGEHAHEGHAHGKAEGKAAPKKAAGKSGAAKGKGKTGAKPAAKGGKGKATPAKQPAAPEGEAAEGEAKPEELEVVAEAHVARAKPTLSEETEAALRLRAAKKAKQPRFRRHEWWRYKELGGKDAPWRNPQGIHSKARRHFKYRPPVVSIGYRGPALARGLHPSGFAEVLVHRPEDLAPVDPKTQAVRIGGTVGGRKAEAIQKKADELGIRVLNRRS